MKKTLVSKLITPLKVYRICGSVICKEGYPYLHDMTGEIKLINYSNEVKETMRVAIDILGKFSNNDFTISKVLYVNENKVDYLRKKPLLDKNYLNYMNYENLQIIIQMNIEERNICDYLNDNNFHKLWRQYYFRM